PQAPEDRAQVAGVELPPCHPEDEASIAPETCEHEPPRAALAASTSPGEWATGRAKRSADESGRSLAPYSRARHRDAARSLSGISRGSAKRRPSRAQEAEPEVVLAASRRGIGDVAIADAWRFAAPRSFPDRGLRLGRGGRGLNPLVTDVPGP